MEYKEPHTIRDLIENMYDFTDVSDEERNTVINEITSMVTEAALLRGLEEAGVESQQAFADLMVTEPDDDDMNAFIDNHIDNFEELVAEEIAIYQSMEQKYREGSEEE